MRTSGAETVSSTFSSSSSSSSGRKKNRLRPRRRPVPGFLRSAWFLDSCWTERRCSGMSRRATNSWRSACHLCRPLRSSSFLLFASSSFTCRARCTRKERVAESATSSDAAARTGTDRGGASPMERRSAPLRLRREARPRPWWRSLLSPWRFVRVLLLRLPHDCGSPVLVRSGALLLPQPSRIRAGLRTSLHKS